MKNSIIKPFVIASVAVLAVVAVAGCNKKTTTKNGSTTSSKTTAKVTTTSKATTAHTHSFETNLSYNETEHYYKCSGCSETKDNDEHVWSNEVINGEKASYTCTCGATKEVSLGKKVTFVTDEHVKVYVYDTQNTTGTGVEATTAYSKDGDTGVMDASGEGQVNFKLVFDEGYEYESVIGSPTASFNKIKKPSDGLGENTFRVTKITDDFTLTITSKSVGAEVVGYKATFVVDSGLTVTVFDTQDTSTGGVVTTTAIAKNGDTGEVALDDTAQLNFTVTGTVPTGYHILVTATEGAYKNIKTPNDESKPLPADTYRITKVSSDITVTITLVADATE